MEKDKIKPRSNSIDVLKGIAALLVCYQHAYGTYGISDYILAISRIAVPLFVMITGFFYYSTVNKHREIIQIKKFTRIAVEMVLLYFFIDSIKNIFTGQAISYWNKCFNLLNIVRFALLNDPIHADHSWYMWAMIYILVFAWKFSNLWKYKCVRRSIIMLTCFGLPFLSKYIFLIDANANIDPNLYRNFLIPIAAYFFLGIECWEKKEKIQKVGTSNWILVATISMVCIFLEKYILSALEIDRLSGSYFFSMPLAIAVFGIALSSCWKNKVFAVIATFGRKYSLIFYIIHPLFSRIEYKIFDMNSLQQYLGYIFVVLGSLTFSILYVTMKEKRASCMI